MRRGSTTTRSTLPTSPEHAAAIPPLPHVRHRLARLALDEVEVSLRSATLVAARPAGSAAIDWEVVASSAVSLDLAPDVYHVAASADGHGPWTGRAVLVRSDGHTHVLRGTGPLGGLDEASLR